jgi:serine/threonine protein kinase
MTSISSAAPKCIGSLVASGDAVHQPKRPKRNMDPLQWQQAKALIGAMLSQEPVDRGAFLSQHCPDPVLRAEIDALLDHQSQSTTLSKLSIGGAADDGNDLPPGSRVGPYVILGPLGRGGMGEVFLGSDTRLHRKVALKCVLRSSDAVSDSRSQILREARAAARVKHPNVAAVHDLIEHAGRTFIVMEYVEGESLAARLQLAPLPVSSVIAIGRQLASALAAAHAQGIVHRDLKPANIQVTPEGSVKVLDFGVAATVALLSTAANATSTSSRGAEVRGVQPGTLGYMSPEQMLGRDVGPRSDIFSLGVVLYEMACGRRPYRGGDPLEILGAVLKRPTPVHELNPQASPRLSEIIARALESDPDRRFESASEFERTLDGLEHSHDTSKVGPDSSSPAEFGGINNLAASELRGRLLLAQSSADLRRLKYEVEGYLSMRPHDVDGRMLNDEIERAIGLVVRTVDDQSKAGRHQETTAERLRRSYYRWAAFAVMAVATLCGGLWLRLAGGQPELRYAEHRPGTLSPQSSAPAPMVPRAQDGTELARPSSPSPVLPVPVPPTSSSARRPQDLKADVEPRLASPPDVTTLPPSTAPDVRPSPVREPPPVQPLQPPVVASPPPAVTPTARPPIQTTVPPVLESPPTPAPSPVASASDEPAIRMLIGAYAEAYSSLDVRAVQRAYPSVNAEALQRGFAQMRSQKVQIQGEQIEINGAIAKVTLTWQMAAAGRVGGSITASSRVELTLEKMGGAWIIVGRR